MADSDSWKKLAEQKEKEWRSILETRIEALDNDVKVKEKELFDEKARFHELKEHFKYNLKLLEERDRELEKYDISFQDIRNSLNSKNAEISELKIKIDDLKNVILREEKAKDELQANYQRRIREKQTEVDAYKSSKDNEVQGERTEYEQFRRDLHRQLASVQGELETQKRELTTEFETALKKREHDFKLQKDELEAKVFESDLKVKLLEKELELSRDTNEKTRNLAEEAETTHRDLEKLLKQKEWELADITAVKDSQISELQNKLSATEATIKKMHEDFQRKYTELDRSVREREDTLERARTGYQEREQALEAVKHELESKLESAQVRERQAIWAHQDEIKEKELAIEKLQEEVQDVRGRWDRHVSEISRTNVERDMELGSAREEQQRLKDEVLRMKEDVQRYKKELKAAAEREDKLDRAKVQTELDWQRRCETLETRQYRESEDLIDSLTVARNQAQALVRERERELHHKVLLIKSLHRERDQMRVLMKDHNIPLDAFVKYSIDMEKTDEEINYVENLQKQNLDLKELIAQMRSEMESLTQESLKSEGKVTDADKQVLADLRHQNHELQDKLKSASKASKSSAVASDSAVIAVDPAREKLVMEEVKGNSVVKNHILALNGTIGNLRSEKIELAASVKKQQVRIAHLENSLEEISKQPRQKQIQIDQLNYEISTTRQRSETEVTGLRRRVEDLELQLGEARREADEFHRAGLEANQELVALGNQLAALKMEQSGSGATINFGAQELYIQQLQNELSQLRKRAAALDGLQVMSPSSGSDTGGATVLGDKAELQYKLRSAAAKIVQLAKENHALTESNNRLRAELKAAIAESKQSDRGGPPGGSSNQFSGEKLRDLQERNRNNILDSMTGTAETRKPQTDVSKDRLSQLEKLQYELTKQQLQFAHRFKDDSQKVQHGSSDSDVIPEKDSNNTAPPQKFSTMRRVTPGPSHNENEPNRLRLSREGVNPSLLMSMSSAGGDSIQQVWQMLDESMTSGVPTEHVPQSPRSAQALARMIPGDGGDESSFTVMGGGANTKDKAGQKQARRSAREVAINYAEKVRKSAQQQQQQQQRPKVRNYNIRDDHTGGR